MPTYISNIDKPKKEATIRLFGMIGREVDGNLFARELASLDDQADIINLHINSIGGDVVQGYSVVSVMLSMKAFVNVYVVGIAASMAAVIAVCGDKMHMYDYSKLMIHDPYFSGLNTEKLSEKQSKSLNSVTDSLRTILSRKGKQKEEIARLMKDETWFSAEEAKTAGLCDDIVSTKQVNEYKGLSTEDLFSRVAAEFSFSPNNNNNMDFKAIAKELGLPENATEAVILAEIKRLNGVIAAQLTAKVDNYLERGAKCGLVTEKNKERMITLANADFDLFAGLVEDAETKADNDTEGASVATATVTTPVAGAEGAKYTRLSAALSAMQSAGAAVAAGAASKKTYDWYQKNDPKALIKMEQEDPKAFNALLDAHEQNFE